MSENIKPLSLVEGNAYIDGVQVMDSAKMRSDLFPRWRTIAL